MARPRMIWATSTMGWSTSPALGTSTVRVRSPFGAQPGACAAGAFTTTAETRGCSNDETELRHFETARLHHHRDHDRHRDHEHWHCYAHRRVRDRRECDAERAGKPDCPPENAGGDGKHLHRARSEERRVGKEC